MDSVSFGGAKGKLAAADDQKNFTIQSGQLEAGFPWWIFLVLAGSGIVVWYVSKDDKGKH